MLPSHTMSLLVCLLFFSLDLVHSSGDVIDFVFNSFASANISVDDSAMITPDGVLVLTNGTTLMKGHGMFPDPLHFRSPSIAAGVLSFSTTFVFAILSEYADFSSYGIAFFVAPTKNFTATLPSQFLGLFNTSNVGNASNHVFAVELDTLLNVEFADISSNHVGINIDGLKSAKATSAGYYDDDGNFLNLSLISGKAMQVWVHYDGRSTEINVTLAPLGVAKPKRPLLSHVVDLSTVITDTSYVGFAAALGSMSSRHCVLGWSFALNGSAPPLDYSKLPKLPVAHRGGAKSSNVLKAVLPIGIVAFVLAVAASAFVFGWRRVKYAELREEWEDEFGPRRFSYKDLFHATGGFTDRHLLGTGGFGKVYKGVLPVSKLEVAVKRVSHDSRQGIREFVSEITSIGRLEHRNLVRLLGYCRRRGELLLVYEYMPNGSLDKYLYACRQMKPTTTLDWGKRFRIIKDVSLGLVYLHNNCEQVIIHRDVKASNVLLDGVMGGHLGDFGLARLHDHGANPRTTRVVGTMGYLAPELALTSKPTPLTDVFAFGVFLMEVTCGRRPFEEDASGERVMLVDWVLRHWSDGSLIDCVDAGLQGDYDAGEVSLVLKLGLLCTQASPEARPSMLQVGQYLDGSLQLPEPTRTKLEFETMYLLQSNGFDSYVTWYPTSSEVSEMSQGTVSDLSGGR